MSFSNEDFLKFWGPSGYHETFDGYQDKEFVKSEMNSILSKHKNANKTALEIGCGRGYWTTQLSSSFQKVTCLDILPSDSVGKWLPKNAIYFQLPDRNFKCSGVPDSSVDFVFSFGVFCHLPFSAVLEYITNIRRVLKPSGTAVLMCPNWNCHQFLSKVDAKDREQYLEKVSFNGWFYHDLEKLQKHCAVLGFKINILNPNDTRMRDFIFELLL